MVISWYCMPSIAQEDWGIVKKNSSVSVYTKYELGKEYKSVKAVGKVQSTPEKLIKILDDVSGYKNWFAYSKSVRILKKGKNKKIVYIESNFPWPFRNEDMIYILSKRQYKNGDVKFLFNGNPEYIPTVKGIKRMRYSHGYILLQQKNEFMKITCVMHSKLSGNIPLWMANKYIHLFTFETINNLIKAVGMTK